jgi:hypothetical protein
MNAKRPYWMEMLVLGIGLGMATNLPRTKKSAAPIPIATIVLTVNFLIHLPP